MTDYDPRRPAASAAVYKGHGLGNDYLVVEAPGPGTEDGGGTWTVGRQAVQRVCHRQEGVGADGVVVLLAPARPPFRLRMFNPDGGEFERSGNGLRVAASHLHRTGRVESGAPFEVRVGGEAVLMTVHGRSPEGGYDISVEMGRARTGADAVGLDPDALTPDGRLPHPEAGPLPVHLVSIGNPHCVLFSDALRSAGFADAPFDPEALARLGPGLAMHPAFEAGTNVQLARVPGAGVEGVVEAFIWERGVGPTTASGTSACAVAVAAVDSERLAPGPIEVRMPGGSLHVDVGEALDVVLRGPVEEVWEGRLAGGFVRSLVAVEPPPDA